MIISWQFADPYWAQTFTYGYSPDPSPDEAPHGLLPGILMLVVGFWIIVKLYQGLIMKGWGWQIRWLVLGIVVLMFALERLGGWPLYKVDWFF